MQIKTGTLGPTWNDFEAARMKREDDGVKRRLERYRHSQSEYFDETEGED